MLIQVSFLLLRFGGWCWRGGSASFGAPTHVGEVVQCPRAFGLLLVALRAVALTGSLHASQGAGPVVEVGHVTVRERPQV